jgi:hypothetical protein
MFVSTSCGTNIMKEWNIFNGLFLYTWKDDIYRVTFVVGVSTSGADPGARPPLKLEKT